MPMPTQKPMQSENPWKYFDICNENETISIETSRLNAQKYR